MLGVCKDCGEPRETKRIIVVRPVLAIAMGQPAVEEIVICINCALKRGVTDWGTK